MTTTTPTQSRVLDRLRQGDRIFIFRSFDGRDPRPEWESNLPEAPSLRRDVLERMEAAGLVTFSRSNAQTHLTTIIVEAA